MAATSGIAPRIISHGAPSRLGAFRLYFLPLAISVFFPVFRPPFLHLFSIINVNTLLDHQFALFLAFLFAVFLHVLGFGAVQNCVKN